MVLLQLGMATAMVKSAAHATGVAASGMSSNNFGLRWGVDCQDHDGLQDKRPYIVKSILCYTIIKG
jgi:hypothetical protein